MIDAANNVWIGSNSSNQLLELNAAGTNLQSVSMQSGAQGIAIDSFGDVWSGLAGGNIMDVIGATKGPEFFPYSGPQFP